MTETLPPALSRRAALGAVGPATAFAMAMAGGLPEAEAATPAAGSALKGPYLDLTASGQPAATAYARLCGNLDTTKTKYGWYDGLVMAVMPNSPVKNICGFKGMSSAKLIKLPNGFGWQKVLREVGYYYDLKTGEIMEEMLNPFTNEKVKVVPVNNDPFNFVVEEFYPPPPAYGGLNKEKPPRIPFRLNWRQMGDRLLMDQHIHLYYPNALDPKKWVRESSGPMNRVSEMFYHNMSAADVQNKNKTSVEYTGTWARVTPWLPWMLMGQADGHVVYQTFMGGFDKIDTIPEDILKYTEKNFPKYLKAPDVFEEPSLSSIEWYAKTEKPAPPKGGV